MKCEIIKDLLPSYVDELTSNESNIEIEQHLESCIPCKEELNKMKKDIRVEEIKLNKKDIKPLKKLNKKIFKYVIVTILTGITLVGSYLYFFQFGWKVNSNDLDITYYLKDDSICFVFKLEDGKVLNANTKGDDFYTIAFTECFESVLDYRSAEANEFSYWIDYKNENGDILLKDSDTLKLNFNDTVKEINLNKILEDLK